MDRIETRLTLLLSDPLAFAEAGIATILRASPFLHPHSRLYWLFLLSFVAGAAWLYLRRDRKREGTVGFFSYLLPRSVFLHPDSIRGYAFTALVLVLHKLVGFATLVVTVKQVGEWTNDGIVSLLGEAPVAENTPFAAVAFLLAVVVFRDLAEYVNHLAFHRIRPLWEFHKVHHCPRVLTPATSLQVHPVERIAKGIAKAIVVGPLLGIYVYAYDVVPIEATVLGISLSGFLFNLLGNFRHSHLWLEFPRGLSHVLSSPAMHQLHHSQAERHWDRNYATAFSLWDWCFGTLYLPGARETFELGVANAAPTEYDSLYKLLISPFPRAWRVIRSSSIDNRAYPGPQGLLSTAESRSVS